jgi:tetratricopeptide (TPR) repeat protein
LAPLYDVAISFAGEDRDKAEQLADFLKNEFKLVVFYDDYERAKLWGGFLPERLLSIYRDMARACVVLVSRNYKAKRWTTHEWRSAQERALNEPSQDYILPVRLDDTTLDGMFDSVGYLDGSSYSMRTIARLVYEKIGDTTSRDGLVRLADQLYREGLPNKALALVGHLPDDGDLELLRLKGLCYSKQVDYRMAIKCFEQVISVRPRDFLSHFHLGIYNFRIGNFEASIRHYEIADHLSPNHPTIIDDLAGARRRLRMEKRRR